MGTPLAIGGKARLREHFINWVTRHHRPARREIRLTRRRIYILPTRHGYLYILLLLLMLLGAVNYSNSMAFILTFLLAGVGSNAMWQTHRNLLDLVVRLGPAQPVFSGQELRFPVALDNPTRRPRYALNLSWEGGPETQVNVPAQDLGQADLRVASRQRGWLRPGRFMLDTTYPLGLFRAWSWLEFDTTSLVYPKPVNPARELPTGLSHRGRGRSRRDGADDYQGLREYRIGDQPQHLAWKAMARIQTPVTKLFADEGREEIWLRWDALPGIEPELRLSMLCHWVIAAEKSGKPYGLDIPGDALPPGQGERHYQRCLKALALHGKRR